MATLTGDIVRLNSFETVYTAVGQVVLVLQEGVSIASGTVDNDESFSIELPAGTAGEVEVRLGMHGTAPVLTTLSKDADQRIQIYYNNVVQYA